jgi:hypothetical protein
LEGELHIGRVPCSRRRSDHGLATEVGRLFKPVNDAANFKRGFW